METGVINPADYAAMWVHGEALQGGSSNQLELPRGEHRFFGFVFDQYDYPHNLIIGEPVLRSGARVWNDRRLRSEEHTSELQSLMRISYAVFCWKKKKNTNQ